MADPRDEIRELIASFLQSHALVTVVDVTQHRSVEGVELLRLRPHAAGAAAVDIETTASASNGTFGINVFVADDGRPIEIAGPINVNSSPPHLPAGQELLEILELVAAGEVYVDTDDEGNVGADVPDPRTKEDFAFEWASRERFQRWSDRGR